MTKTRTRVRKLYSVYQKTQPPAKPFIANEYLSVSDWKMEEILRKVPNAVSISCKQYNSFCRSTNLNSKLIDNLFESSFVHPQFHPPDTIDRLPGGPLREVMLGNDLREVKRNLRGRNKWAPSMGAIFQATVNDGGSLVSPGIFLPSAYDGKEQLWELYNSSKTRLPRYREILVVSHLHQDMFWHWSISQFFRMFPAVEFLRQNPDIPLHLSGDSNDWNRKLLAPLLGKDASSRFIHGSVTADIIYYMPLIHRDDVPSIGLTIVMQHLIFSSLFPFSLQRRVAPQPTASDDKQTITILLANRPMRSWNGRGISNYYEMKEELQDYLSDYTRDNVRLLEDKPHMSNVDRASLYAAADIAIAPHGAGMSYTYYMKPGSHVIEFMVPDCHFAHINMVTSARLGLAWHGCTSNNTEEGIYPGSPNVNMKVDPKLVVSVVKKILGNKKDGLRKRTNERIQMLLPHIQSASAPLNLYNEIVST